MIWLITQHTEPIHFATSGTHTQIKNNFVLLFPILPRNSSKHCCDIVDLE